MSDQFEVIYSVLEYLNALKEQGKNADAIDTITGLIESEFPDASLSADNFKKYSFYPQSLQEIFAAGKNTLSSKVFSESLAEAKSDPKFETFLDAVVKRGYFEGAEEGSQEYLQRYAKLLQKYKAKVASGPSTAELEQQAEDLKFKGNAAINAKDYEGAIKYYTEALQLSSEGPNSHVYYSNRAAAYCHLNRYQESVDDCLSSVALSPDYVKAYSRLGLSYFFLEKYQDAVDAYERAAELEPDNKATQDSLRQARNKLSKKSKTAPAASPSDLAAGLPPGMNGLMNNPAMKKAMDQVGGAAGLSSLMRDPQMMAMAQQMMKDPAMMQQAMSMLGGGGEGMPDMSALAGLMGGGGGAPQSAPSSSSGKKGGFKGFEE